VLTPGDARPAATRPSTLPNSTEAEMTLESITLHPHQHAKLGRLHVGVTRAGFISVAGEVHDIANGEVVRIARVPVSVIRFDDDYTFSRLE
jgi:hypothetical protein